MCDEAIRNTKKCLFGYKCLNKDPGHPVCTVVGANAQNALIVSNAIVFNCPYRGHFGNARVCTCPKHYSLHCKKEAGCAIEHPDDVAAHILARLVMELVKTHKRNSVS
jgi:hypothetical protein